MEEGQYYLLRVRGATPQAINIYDIAVVPVDTLGPQVTDVYLTDVPDYDLFAPKPFTDGPTPLTSSLTVRIQDLPERFPGFLYGALNVSIAEQPGHYRLVGDHNGVIPIAKVIVNNDPVVTQEVATASIILEFYEPLPDDRFTLTVSDSLTDPPGLSLDGESNAVEPQETPLFPTGDAVPGGVFAARFTIDTRAELGVWAVGSVYVDTNGNYLFDPEGADNDDTNEDIVYVLGYTSDNIFAGNFADLVDNPHTLEDETLADGFDKLGAYGYVGGEFRWMIDTDNNGVPNIVQVDNAEINGLPVAGNFDVSDPSDPNDPGLLNGDEVALKDGTTWHFDTDHDFQVDSELVGNIVGLPIVGDFDGDGFDDLGGWADDTFQLDTNADGLWDFEFTFGFNGVRERPIAADFDGDGIDDIGLWVPDRSGATPSEAAEWYILVSGGDPIADRLVLNQNPGATGSVIDFIPQPFGQDIYAKFGDEYALPAVGNYDPPVAGGAAPQYEYYSYTNDVDPLDVNGDLHRTSVDALMIINVINANGSGYVLETFRSEAVSQGPFYDTSANGVVSALDALLVIDALNNQLGLSAEGEAAPLAVATDVVAPAVGTVDQVQLVSQTDDADTVAQAIAYQQPARDDTAFESLYDASDDTVEELLDDLAEDIATVWSEI